MPTYSDEILRFAEITPVPISSDVVPAELANRLCGDRISVALKTDADTVTAVEWQVEGCAILKASAAFLARTLNGKSTAESAALIHEFSESFENENIFRQGPLAAVYRLPARYKCALLPWQASENFLRNLKR